MKDLSGNVTGSISVTDKGSIAVTGTLTAGEDVSIQAAENGNITVSGIIHAANTFLRGAAKIIVTVKDTMGNLGVKHLTVKILLQILSWKAVTEARILTSLHQVKSDLLPQKQMRSSTSLQTVSR